MYITLRSFSIYGHVIPLLELAKTMCEFRTVTFSAQTLFASFGRFADQLITTETLVVRKVGHMSSSSGFKMDAEVIPTSQIE